MFFPGGRGGSRKRQKQQLKPTVIQKEISLKEAFHGKIMKVEYKRQKVCLDCDGKGGENIETCAECKGQGIVIKMVQMGPGMYA